MATPRTTKVRHAAVLALALTFALVGASCGGSDGSDDARDDAAASGTVPPTTEESTSSTTDDEVPGTPDEASIPGATIFVDPQGLYTLEVSPAWDDQTGSGTLSDEIELFYVGTGTADFNDNINVLVQSVPASMDLQDYLDASIAEMGDLEVVTSGVAEGAYGQELGYIEYKGMVATAPIPVHAFATFFIEDGQVVLATLTTTEETAAEAEDTIAEYLTTLNPTGGGSNT